MQYWGFSSAGSINVDDMRTRGGEFAAEDLQIAADRPELMQHAVDQWKRLAEGKITLAFCVSVQHAQDMAECFNSNGIPADSVSAETPREARQELYRRLGSKELMVLTSVNVLAIGFDLPNVEALLCARPTRSVAVWLQQLGRGARAHPGKEKCIVLDSAGNTLRLGPLEAEREWELKRGKEKGPSGGNPFPMRQCEECGHLVPPKVQTCPECGAEMPEAAQRPARTDDLQELRFDKAAERRRKQLHRWILKSHRLGYLQHWVMRNWQTKYPPDRYPEPTLDMWRGAIYGDDPSPFDAVGMAEWWGRICRQKNRSWPIALTAITREFGEDFVADADLKALRLHWQRGYDSARLV